MVDFFADFDRLRHGKIKKNEFRRALKVVFPDVTEFDLKLLESKFINKKEPNYVEYLKFSDTIDAVFTKKGMRDDPTAEPAQFEVYSNGWEADPFAPELSDLESTVLTNVMLRLNECVIARRVDFLKPLEDYDFVNEGEIIF